MISGAILQRLLDGADDTARREVLARAVNTQPLVVHGDGTASFLGSDERMPYEPSERNRQAEAIERELGHPVRPTGVYCTPWQTQDRLRSVGVYVSLPALAAMSWAERMHAYVWADAVERIDPCDTISVYPVRPEWLPPRDARTCAMRMLEEYPNDLASLAAFRTYHTEWREPNELAAEAKRSAAHSIARIASRRARRHF